MRKFFPVEELARDERFTQITMRQSEADPRTVLLAEPTGKRPKTNRLTPDRPDASEAARSLMHGIFVGEIQALEGAGRTCFDFETGSGDAPDTVPFALKLDMARQAWDEARHVEISVKLSDWMGSEIGQFAENTVLFEVACSSDPVFRLAGVNRALEGLAIDVFTTMKEFGDIAGDPYLEFCEDWMLADEVTHVKMGSDWLRRVTENDPERRKNALEFQSVVDKIFSFGGTRSDSNESPIGLARRFRELAGFTNTEVQEIADVSLKALEERKAFSAASLNDGDTEHSETGTGTEQLADA
ncbi:MAG: DUF455 family protein [Ilumatobacteraceae bacterium]|nr:DUF455 family protein [Acidimicrobiaceae bacterium]HQY14594.1 DUF455 family protein [Ilumatobacteraceae bacterium]